MRKRKGRRGNIGIGLGVGVPFPQKVGAGVPVSPVASPSSSLSVSRSSVSPVSVSPVSLVSVSPKSSVSVSPGPSLSPSSSKSPSPPSASSLSAFLTCANFGAPVLFDLMAGIQVTARFADGSSETVTWATGQAIGTNWVLSSTADTLSAPWTLNNVRGTAMTSLVINGQPGGIVFNQSKGTFNITSGTVSTDVITASYEGAVAQTGKAPVGDRWGKLHIFFSGPGGGFDGNAMLLLEDGFTPLLLEDGTPLYLESGGRQLTFTADTELCLGSSSSPSSRSAVSSSSGSKGDGLGGFGPVNLKLLFHVECEYNCWTSTSPFIPCGSGDPVVRWDDLTGNGNNLYPLAVPPGTPSQVTRYGTGATPTGRPNIQLGTDWRGLFQNPFTNFFQRTRQLSYAVFYRSASTHIALFDDGNPLVNGLAIGYGVGNLDSTGSGSTMMGIKDGAGLTEDTGIFRLINSAFVVTYDGRNNGQTFYYLCRPAIPGPGFTFDVAGPFSQLGFNGTGGFSLGGTVNNVDGNRIDTSLSLCEAAVWEGILSVGLIQQIADSCGNYWGYG